ncbi:hypothetical protein [Pseudomonas orientalis]|uniref:hypothetical protein n=1 Tax=Pseudomonas orientalis TaxID=76758 RepID=UPI000F564E09|nr:hypothetical protein [Pseudomonas orientalis]
MKIISAACAKTMFVLADFTRKVRRTVTAQITNFQCANRKKQKLTPNQFNYLDEAPPPTETSKNIFSGELK